MSELTKGKPASATHHTVWRVIGWSVITLVALLIVLFLGFWYYTTTADFQHRVGAKVVSVLEDATGGRVELGHIAFDLRHLAIEADDLVIHGTEPAGEAPYISVHRLLLRVKLNTFLAQGTSTGPKSHVGVSYLRAEQPHFHLIVDKNGHTNQPVPKTPSTSTEPVQNTLLDLQAGHVELVDGIALINDRAVPINVLADQLNAQVHYLASSDRYAATIDLANLQTQIAAQPDVHSKLHLDAQLGRDTFQLDDFRFQSGQDSTLTASALVKNFAKPEWQANVNGQLDLKQVGYLANVDGFKAGNAELVLNGRNCEVEPAVAQKHPHFWQRRNPDHAPVEAKMLAPSPDCKSGYLLVGNIKVNHASYVLPDVRATDINASAQLHVTPTELLFSALTGKLPGGGTIDGQLKIENWLGEVPQDAAATSATAVAAAKTANNVAKGAGAAPPVQDVKITPVQRAHAYLTVVVNRITLRTILNITGPQPFGDLGLDTQVSGPLNVEWGGPATDIASSVLADANLHLTPTGQPQRGARQNIPLSGQLTAKYDGASEIVRIQTAHLSTPATSVEAHGTLGVEKGDPLTDLAVNLQSSDLGEFDSTLQSLGVTSNGKKGTAALPIVLHGTLSFNGTAKGSLKDLDVKGHLAANNIEVKLGTQLDTQIDSIVADAEFSPSRGLAVGSSTIRRQTAVLNASGTLLPRRVVRHGVVSYVFDDGAVLNANAKLANANIHDLLEIAGQAQKINVTGTANLTAHVAGPLRALNGNADVAFTNGTAYGQSYDRIAVTGTLQGQQITASRLQIVSNGQQITGSGGYNLTTKRVNAHVQGNGIVLSKINAFKQAVPDADGVLNLNVDADGTLQIPNLKASLDLSSFAYQGKSLGQLHLTANSTGSDVNYQLQSTLIGTAISATGKTSLLGQYQTQARLVISNLDIAKPLALFGSDFKGTSDISGVITVSGPAADPKQLAGTAEFTPFNFVLQGIALQAAAPLRASLHDGVLSVDELHLKGEDTDLRLGGTARVLGSDDPQGGELALKTQGSLNMALAHTFDKDIISSGKVNFQIGVGGRLKDPQITGKVQFAGVNLAYYGVPNGLTDLQGTMVFNQNRLEVKDLTAVTGGGKLKIGGYLIYQKGVIADLTATGDNVRIRYNGLSTTANAQFRLQGNLQTSLLLSGSIQITRFGIGPDVDFAAFAGAGGVSLPPDPNAASNKIRLDVHITSAPQLDFQNSYAKLAGNVDLSIRGTAAQPSVLGKIQITDGNATFAGTKYQLQRGTIYFTNPVRIDPVVDLDATARVENYDVTISLHGTATSLKPTYRSEPPLTEADIFNLLALGRTQEESQIYNQQQVQAGTDPTTSALLGGALNATVSSRVSKLFGAGSVKIDPAFVGTLGNSSARITVQEPLTKQLTLVFATNVNQSAQQLIQIQYQISDNKSLVLTRDESGVFSIVFKIRKRYR